MELPEPTEKGEKKQKANDAAHLRKTYQGPPIPAKKLYSKVMKGFSAKQGNKAEAIAYAAVTDDTITYLNLDNGFLTASYDPASYRFPITPKAQKKLDEGWTEVDPDEWPSVVTSARKRKANK
jgi:hypothetical protein